MFYAYACTKCFFTQRIFHLMKIFFFKFFSYNFWYWKHIFGGISLPNKTSSDCDQFDWNTNENIFTFWSILLPSIYREIEVVIHFIPFNQTIIYDIIFIFNKCQHFFTKIPKLHSIIGCFRIDENQRFDDSSTTHCASNHLLLENLLEFSTWCKSWRHAYMA